MFVNFKQSLCSISPVFNLSKIDHVCVIKYFVAESNQNQLMGLRVDIKKVDKEIEKAKKMLNVMTESHPCFEMTDEERK